MAPSAQLAAALAGDGDSVIGWRLDEDERHSLLARFPPKYRNTVADHVTLRSHAAVEAALPQETEGTIVGCADDGHGVEAMVVAIAGAVDRPDGRTYHITWSLADGRRAKESNAVIAERGWSRLDQPIPVSLKPARFR